MAQAIYKFQFIWHYNPFCWRTVLAFSRSEALSTLISLLGEGGNWHDGGVWEVLPLQIANNSVSFDFVSDAVRDYLTGISAEQLK
jgi:hypothetical protein